MCGLCVQEKADYQGQLEDPTTTQGRRELLEGWVKDCEDLIQGHKQWLDEHAEDAPRAAAALQTITGDYNSHEYH